GDSRIVVGHTRSGPGARWDSVCIADIVASGVSGSVTVIGTDGPSPTAHPWHVVIVGVDVGLGTGDDGVPPPEHAVSAAKPVIKTRRMNIISPFLGKQICGCGLELVRYSRIHFESGRE